MVSERGVLANEVFRLHVVRQKGINQIDWWRFAYDNVWGRVSATDCLHKIFYIPSRAWKTYDGQVLVFAYPFSDVREYGSVCFSNRSGVTPHDLDLAWVHYFRAFSVGP